MSEWRTTTIGSLVEEGTLEFGDGYRTKRPELGAPGLPILRVAEVLDGKISPSFVDYVHESHTQKMGRKISQAQDIILTTKGTVGRTAIVPKDSPDFVYSPQVCYFRLSESSNLDRRYLYYWFKSDQFWNQASSLMSQTDMAAYLNLADIRSLRISVPNIDTQKNISKPLSVLDDKIALNDQISASIDSLASALFAKTITSSAGAQESSLASIAKVNTQSIRKQSKGKLRYLDIASVGIGSHEWPDPIDWSDAPGRARRLASPGDTVWSTVRPNRRSHALLLDSDPNLVVSTGLAVLTPHNSGPAFLYESTRTHEFQTYLENVAEGSAYPAVNSSKFLEAPVVLPTVQEMQAFEENAMPLRKRAHQATVESRKLAELRDTLLPQLMSGKLRVKDAEKIVEDNV